MHEVIKSCHVISNSNFPHFVLSRYFAFLRFCVTGYTAYRKPYPPPVPLRSHLLTSCAPPFPLAHLLCPSLPTCSPPVPLRSLLLTSCVPPFPLAHLLCPSVPTCSPVPLCSHLLTFCTPCIPCYHLLTSFGSRVSLPPTYLLCPSSPPLLSLIFCPLSKQPTVSYQGQTGNIPDSLGLVRHPWSQGTPSKVVDHSQNGRGGSSSSL